LTLNGFGVRYICNQLNPMKITELYKVLPNAIQSNMNILLIGAPGVGKSDVIAEIVNKIGYEFMILHPVVSNPVDFKGLPVSGVVNGELTADFIPYGDLNKMMKATKELVVLLDDLGQAPASVQASIMQLVLAREVNGKKISDKVRFIAATNDKNQNAGVSGLITPLLSRFAGIFKIEVDSESWIEWALKNNMPNELIAYIHAKPQMLSTFNAANKSIENFACPRTIANLGKWMNLGVINHEVWSGAVGEVFATEFMAFYKICTSIAKLPAEIIANPASAEIPSRPDILYFVLTALANKSKDESVFAKVMIYLNRIPKEYEAFTVKNIVVKNPKMKETHTFINWHVNNSDVVI
jgi:ATPase family associated with various cellular activities (AAA)